MSKVKDLMINTYCVNGIDFMGYKLQKGENFTYHHIVKREHGGGKNLKNGAILTKQAHKYLHIVEYKEHDIYIAINSLFKIINRSKKPPTKEMYMLINELLEMFEEKHMNDLTAKKRELIQKSFLNRVQKEKNYTV